MSRKGQFIDLIAVTMLLSITSGTLFGAFTINDKISESVDYNIGDANDIAETELKAQFFDTRARKEANYTASIVALNLDGNEGDADIKWAEIGDETKPEDAKEDLREKHASKIARKLEKQLKMAGKCRNKKIENVEIEEVDVELDVPFLGETGIGSLTSLDIEFESPWVLCTDDYAETKVKLPEGKEIRVDNWKNRYPEISSTAVEVAENANEEAPSDEEWSEGEGVERSGCVEDPDRQSIVTEAEMEARNNAEKDENFHEEGLEDIMPLDTGQSSTAINYEYPERDIDSGSCTYEVEVEVECEDDEEDSDSESTSDDSSGSDSTCTETREKEGREVNASITADVESIDLSYVLKDNVYEVVDSTGKKRHIEFEFDYRIRLE